MMRPVVGLLLGEDLQIQWNGRHQSRDPSGDNIRELSLALMVLNVLREAGSRLYGLLYFVSLTMVRYYVIKYYYLRVP